MDQGNAKKETPFGFLPQLRRATLGIRKMPYCGARIKPQHDRLGIVRALREDEYGW